MKYLIALLILCNTANAATTLRSRSGANATIADNVASNFQCLIDRLDALAYPIKFMSGYRAHGSVRHSLHPLGRALDINQISRNRVTHSFPMGINKMASSCGLFHGALWHNADTGHFQYQNARSSLTGRRRLSSAGVLR